MAVTKSELLKTLGKFRLAQELIDEDKFLTKEDAANFITTANANSTFLKKSDAIVLTTTPSNVDGAIWIELS